MSSWFFFKYVSMPIPVETALSVITKSFVVSSESVVVSRGQSRSVVVSRGQSWSVVVSRGQSWYLVRPVPNYNKEEEECHL